MSLSSINFDPEQDRSYYPRMKYGHDRREWVKAANENLPKLIEEAIWYQKKAAENFFWWEGLTFEEKEAHSYMLPFMAEEYAEARRKLWRVLHYQGMHQANLD